MHGQTWGSTARRRRQGAARPRPVPGGGARRDHGRRGVLHLAAGGRRDRAGGGDAIRYDVFDQPGRRRRSAGAQEEGVVHRRADLRRRSGSRWWRRPAAVMPATPSDGVTLLDTALHPAARRPGGVPGHRPGIDQEAVSGCGASSSPGRPGSSTRLSAASRRHSGHDHGLPVLLPWDRPVPAVVPVPGPGQHRLQEGGGRGAARS